MTAAVFGGGVVRTGDPAQPVAEAIAIREGRIVAVGPEALSVAVEERIDLAGGCLLPAFRDGHAHPMQGGVELDGVPVVGASSIEAVTASVAAYASQHPEHEWLVGGGYDPSLAPGGRFDAAWLDAACAQRPVLLIASDHHTAWVNSRALELAGIDAATPDPQHGTIERWPDGSPSGTLREAAVELVRRVVPPPRLTDRVAGLRRALERFAAAGVAWVQDAWVEAEDVAAYVEAARGDLACRVNLALLASPRSWPSGRDALREARREVDLAGGDAVSCRTVKFFADGIVEGGTAALLEPYVDDPCSRGIANWSGDQLAEAVVAVDEDGFQTHIHAIGDAGIRTALDAVEEVVRRRGPRDRRPVIAHVQLPDPADLPRFARLGVVANFEPLWAQLDACQVQLTMPRLGPERSARQYPVRALIDSGALVSFGSDWPVSSLAPLEGIAVAVTRQTDRGEPAGGWTPHERVTIEQALAAYTVGSAYQGYDDDAGVLRVGARADLVWLAADPVSVAPRDLPDVAVLGTWCSGRATFVR